MIKRFSTPDELTTAAALIRNHKIYSPSGSIRGWIIDEYDAQQAERGGLIVDPSCRRIKSIYLRFDNDVPIACFVILVIPRWRGHNCGIYVKQEHRLKGIGRSLVQQAQADGEEILPWLHSTDANRFYLKALTKI